MKVKRVKEKKKRGRIRIVEYRSEAAFLFLILLLGVGYWFMGYYAGLEYERLYDTFRRYGQAVGVIKPEVEIIIQEFEYSDNISLKVSSDYNYTWFISNYGILKSIKLDGGISKDGLAKVYLEHDDKLYLIFDSSRLGNKGVSAITGSVIQDIVAPLEPKNNKEIIVKVEGEGLKPIDDVFELKVGSKFNWNVDYDKLCTKWQVNSANLCYGAEECCALIGLDSMGSWNSSLYLNYGRYGSGLHSITKVQIIYVNYSLNIEKPYTDIVYSDNRELEVEFYKNTSFKDRLGISSITGSLVGNVINLPKGINKSPNNENKQIVADMQAGGRKTTEDVFEFRVNGEFNWNVDYNKLCTKWGINSASVCYGAEDCCALINFESLGPWNSSLYLSYGRYGAELQNIIRVQIIYANYSLDIEKPYADIVYSDIKETNAEFHEEGIKFEDICIDTCLLPGFNESSYKLVFLIENGTLRINNIKYSIEKEINISKNAPSLVKEIKNITLYKNKEIVIDLSSYFNDEDKDKLTYSVYGAENVNIVVDNSIITLIPEYNFTGKRYIFFTASDGYYNVTSNVFSVNVVEKPLKVEEVNISEKLIKPRVVINRPVRWVKKVKASDRVINLSVNISSDALNVSVRDVKEDRVISEDKLKINDKGVIKNATAYRIEKRIGQIEKIEDKLFRKKEKTIKEDPTAKQAISEINEELLDLDNERNRLTGYAVSYYSKKDLLALFLKWLSTIKITGYAIYDPTASEDSNATSVIIEDIIEEVEIEYYTEGPVSEEENITNGKRIVVSSDVHYEDILAYTYLDDVPKESIRLYHIVNGNRELVSDVDYYDENNNNLIDVIEWIIPSLSNETYEVIITVLNVQSYPMVGGNWTVRFNTTGTANLTITAVNGTTFTEIYDNSSTEDDLEFLEIKCDSNIVNASVVLEDGRVVPYDVYLKIKRVREIDEMLR